MEEPEVNRAPRQQLRATSLGAARSRSRGRVSKPSELLARKQQLVSEQLADQSGNWSGEDHLSGGGGVGVGEHRSRRSPIRRARPEEIKIEIEGEEERNRKRASSVELKLESLTNELLKQQEDQLQSSPISGDGKSIDNVYILLAKKEKDLQLAAELGKVLLEKNDELSKANERITEDYSHKLEVSTSQMLDKLVCCFGLGLSLG